MLADLMKQIRLLPYPDMMLLADALEKELRVHPKPSASQYAESLAKVATRQIESAEIVRADHKLLIEMFGRRRSISIKSGNGAFEIELQTLHARVVSQDLRGGLNQLVDTVVAARALRGST